MTQKSLAREELVTPAMDPACAAQLVVAPRRTETGADLELELARKNNDEPRPRCSFI